MIRWIHISDLHLGSKDMTTDMLRDELPKFLVNKGLHCDYVFCTGDIKTAGKGDCGFTDDMAKYIKGICQATGTSVDNFFIVPGNHEINREIVERNAAIEKVMFQRKGYYDPAKGIINHDDMASIMEGQNEFKDFLTKIFPADRVAMYGNPDRPHFCIETPDFNILHVDSTVVYSAEQEANDLIVGNYALYQVVRGLNDKKPTILLTHYPFTSLLQDEKKMISTMLHHHEVRLWLAGHEHDHVVQQIHYIYQLQAGELRNEDKANATFLIGEYDKKTGRVQVVAYTWFPEGWAQYPILDLDNFQKDRYEFTLRVPADKGMSIEARAAKEANKQYYHRLPAKVERNLLPCIDSQDGISTLDKLLNESWESDAPHIIILADGGMGKTTMLLDYCANTSEPVLYVPVERLVALETSIEQYCISSVYDNDKERFRSCLYTKYTRPTLTLFIDGLNEVDSKKERAFILEIQRLNMLKGLRIVVTSRSNFTIRYSMPGYRTTHLHPLDDTQVSGYFSEDEWAKIKGEITLHRLLGNPMMVTIYKEICSVIDEFKDVEFLNWILPVRNATDLLHNYYVAQLALMMKQGEMDGKRILLAAICIKEVIPAIAYEYEIKRRLNLSQEDFRTLLDGILQRTEICREAILPIQEHYREEELPLLTEMKVSDLLTQTLRLLYRDKTITAFPHQIYRDYLAAQWIIIQSQKGKDILNLWNSRKIPHPVMLHIRQGSGEYWKNGIANIVHQTGTAYKGDNACLLVDNLLACFPGTELSGTPDYSGLWLRGHRLPDNPVGARRINLSGAEIDNKTLGLSADDLTLYTNVCLSEDREFLAAIAVQDNGHRIFLYIYSIEDGTLIYHHELNRKISKMEFHGNHLFVVSGGIFVFTLQVEGWHYTGEIHDGNKNVTRKLQKAVVADNTLYLYYYSRMVSYDLRDCHMIGIANGKLWENVPAQSEDVTSLKNSVPWAINDSRQTDMLSEDGDQSLLVRSYGDGGLIVESGGELQLELSRGSILLMDAAISGDGRTAATLGFHVIGQERKIQLWDLDREKKLADMSCPAIVKNLHLSETGKWLMGETDDKTWVMDSESGGYLFYNEHFVSNHTGRLITYGNKVIRKKDGALYLFDLQTRQEELLKSPVANPKMVCFMPDKTLAAVDERGTSLYLWSTRDGKILSQYMEGREIYSIQPIQSKPFIAVFTSDMNIRIYHTGVRREHNKMQCLIKEAGSTIAKQMVAHQEIPLMANTDGHRYLETRFFKEWKDNEKEKGLWYSHRMNQGRSVIDGNILDIAFNVRNQQLVAILDNGRILFCSDKECLYRDSFKIITAFNVNAYDFSQVVCSEQLKQSLKRNGAL